MAKEKISRNEYLQLSGLLMVAKKHEEQIKELAVAISDIVNPERQDKTGMNDWVAEEIYSDGAASADRLLSNLKMSVEPESEVSE